MQRYAGLFLCLILFSASSASADFYRWIDKDGREVYSNDLEQVPQEYRNNVSVVKPDAGRVSVGNKTDAPRASHVTAGEHRDKYGRGEEYWRRRAANLRLKLRDQQDEYDLVLKQLDDEDGNVKKKGKKKKSASSLEKKKMKLEKDMAQTRRVLEVDLPEEARRADAYPGWLRE